MLGALSCRLSRFCLGGSREGVDGRGQVPADEHFEGHLPRRLDGHGFGPVTGVEPGTETHVFQRALMALHWAANDPFERMPGLRQVGTEPPGLFAPYGVKGIIVRADLSGI